MTPSNQEAAFVFSKNVIKLLSIKDQWGCDIVWLNHVVKSDENALHEDITKIKVLATYTAKNDDVGDILQELIKVQNTVVFKTTTQLKNLGYTITNHKITSKDIENQFEDFNYGCEHDFSAPIFDIELSASAYRTALSSTASALRIEKKSPLYHEFGIEKCYSSEPEKIIYLFKDLTLKNVGSEKKQLINLAQRFDKLAMGAQIFDSEIEYITTSEVIEHKYKILMEAKATIKHENKLLNLKVFCHSPYLEVAIFDENGYTYPELLVRETLDISFLNSTKAKMKNMMNQNLVKGVKVETMDVTFLNKKIQFSNFARYSEISVIIPDFNLNARNRDLIRLTIKKSGEITTFNMNGTVNESATQFMINHLKSNGEFKYENALKLLFCSNREFACAVLKKVIGKNDVRAYKKFLF